MRNSVHLLCGLLMAAAFLWLPAQTSNILITNPTADQVIKGNYNPADYLASTVLNHPDSIIGGLLGSIAPDSLQSYLVRLSEFFNRNTGSDTVSSTTGIGAARRWALGKFQEFSAENENRLLTGYLQFDRTVCGMGQHRNVLGVLPGIDADAEGIIIIEGHMDSRCDGNCDINCAAYGADDNGSGTVLVIELARVLSRYSFNHTIVFMLTTGEEQGLFGADAMANYCFSSNIPVKAVLNNDIVGGIFCGTTASPPGCPGAGDIDSLNVRIYSAGGYNSPHKQLARYVKLEYKEELLSQINVPMAINIMSGEDRTGRGGDHIPFRQRGFSAIRFTSANEHGNGNPSTPGYMDRQHTSEDSIGIDLDNDGNLDSFYVDFNYLARNALINANAAGLIGIGPETPTFSAVPAAGGIEVNIASAIPYPAYRVAIRQTNNDWDTVYTLTGPLDTLLGLTQGTTIILSVAAVDSNGIESLFSNEDNLTLTGIDGAHPSGVSLLPNRPNPFDEQTIITVRREDFVQFEEAFIRISDIKGREVERIPMTLEADINEVYFYHGFHARGVYFYSLVIDGRILETRRMVME
ncbi:MAG: M28 family peptidase [Bacteroidota bacterium]